MSNEILKPGDIIDPQALETGSLVQYEFAGQSLLLETHREVWSPTKFTLGMCEMISRQDFTGRTVIDLASGSGILGILAAMRGASNVIFLDINPVAIEMSQKNWRRNGFSAHNMYAIPSDCFSAFQAFPRLPLADAIVSNPPTAPASQTTIDHEGVRMATEWNSVNNGDGRKVTDAVITDGYRFLKPGGELMFVTTRKNGTLTTAGLLSRTYGPGILLPDGSEDPLYYSDTTTTQFNWKVENSFDIKLDDWYLPYLGMYGELNERRGDLSPVVIGENGDLHQRLYFIRARKTNEV